MVENIFMEKFFFKNEFLSFLENRSRKNLQDLLENNLGEFADLEFKATWPTPPNLARYILGLANSGGGCIIIGVEEKDDKSLHPKGLGKLEEKKAKKEQIKKYLPHILFQSVEIGDYSYSKEADNLEGHFQIVYIPDKPNHLPFLAEKESGNEIFLNAVYIRRGASTEIANHDELQDIINRRLETGYSSSSELDALAHIEQLKILYGLIQKYQYDAVLINFLSHPGKEINPVYPQEDFEQFIARMIEKKKKRIEIALDVIDL